MARHKNCDWDLPLNNGTPHRHSAENVHSALLMDVRDELQALNRLLACQNVIRGFLALSKIAARDERTFKRRVENTARKRVARAQGRSRG